MRLFTQLLYIRYYYCMPGQCFGFMLTLRASYSAAAPCLPVLIQYTEQGDFDLRRADTPVHSITIITIVTIVLYICCIDPL